MDLPYELYDVIMCCHNVCCTVPHRLEKDLNKTKTRIIFSGSTFLHMVPSSLPGQVVSQPALVLNRTIKNSINSSAINVNKRHCKGVVCTHQHTLCANDLLSLKRRSG